MSEVTETKAVLNYTRGTNVQSYLKNKDIVKLKCGYVRLKEEEYEVPSKGIKSHMKKRNVVRL